MDTFVLFWPNSLKPTQLKSQQLSDPNTSPKNNNTAPTHTHTFNTLRHTHRETLILSLSHTLRRHSQRPPHRSRTQWRTGSQVRNPNHSLFFSFLSCLPSDLFFPLTTQHFHTSPSLLLLLQVLYNMYINMSCIFTLQSFLIWQSQTVPRM